ncbi:bifunctional phosphatase PAP2/diacylglycerol kinase family protein [Actinocorallia populi]|uniref:bifunctional phosphatase PAP2/diacylglycerol kinase family protein n=1 Tax=Actinocorallia populi TaxID=2079200 RepID=UPI000D08E90B|nr:bifunctional phosphatase PAP2/diacylglycerol kinase family protein [Actinocorallia populi]
MDLAEIDRRAFDSVAAARLRGLEFVLPRLSKAADHGMLWFGLAGALGSTGIPALRRGALRGVIAIGLASPSINLVGKQLFRRRRPLIHNVPPIRIHRIPTSPSFPSGHSASAAAFATAIALEAPKRVALPVLGLAAGVAFSRIYTGAHYPGDVLAGILSGAVAGATTRLLWPTQAPAHVTNLNRVIEPRDSQGAGVIVVSNNDPETIADLRTELPHAEFVNCQEDLEGTLEDAAQRARVLAVCGGDGTVSAAAAAALRHDVPLLVLPLGTLNHFAKTLGIETVSDALDAYWSGSVARVDVAALNDVLFLNTASFGAYSELVDRREGLEKRIGKWPALAISAFRVLRHATPVDVTVNGEPRQVWLAFIGNCEYGTRGAIPTTRDNLTDALLDVRLVSVKRHLRRLRALAVVLAGRLWPLSDYESTLVESLTVTSRNGLRLRVAHDGETEDARTPIVFTKHPKQLTVFVPI